MAINISINIRIQKHHRVLSNKIIQEKGQIFKLELIQHNL